MLHLLYFKHAVTESAPITLGGIDYKIIEFFLAAIFWGVLLLIFRNRKQADKSLHHSLLVAGFSLLFIRELLFIALHLLPEHGIIYTATADMAVHFLEHTIFAAILAIITAGFMGRCQVAPQSIKRFLVVSLTLLFISFGIAFLEGLRHFVSLEKFDSAAISVETLFQIITLGIFGYAINLIFKTPKSRLQKIVGLIIVFLLAGQLLEIPHFFISLFQGYAFSALPQGLFFLTIPLLWFLYDTEIKNQHNRTEYNLKKSEERFRIYFEQSPLGASIADQTGRFLKVNPALCRMTGYSANELEKLTFIDITHPDDRPKSQTLMAPLLNGEIDRVVMNKRYLRKDGRTLWGHLNCSLERDEDGRPLHFLPIIEDITTAKTLEEKLVASEARFRAIVEDQTELICRFRPDTTLTYVNKPCSRYFGLNANDLIGYQLISPHSDGNGSDPMIPEQDQKRLKELLDSLTPETPTKSIEHRLVMPNGETRWMHWTNRALFDKDKNRDPIEFQTVGHDITERKELETELQESHKELQESHMILEQIITERTEELQKTHRQLLQAEKLSSLGQLAASVAHEFGSPIFGIRNVLQALQKQAILNKDHAALVDLAIQECGRMKDLLANLQNFNRPTEGISMAMDVHEAIDNMLTLCKKNFNMRGLEVERAYSADVPKIFAVPDQIKQVILNLLNNAEAAIPESGGTIRIITAHEKDRIVIHIEDSGRGISPETLPHIFEPFFTTKSAVEGTGLGLSVSYGIIKNHGGEINVLNCPGGGTAFKIILPVDRRNQTADTNKERA